MAHLNSAYSSVLTDNFTLNTYRSLVNSSCVFFTCFWQGISALHPSLQPRFISSSPFLRWVGIHSTFLSLQYSCGWRDLLYIYLWMAWFVIYRCSIVVDGVICYISVDGVFIIAVFSSPAFICDVSDNMPRSRRNGGVTLMGYPCLMIAGRDFALEVLKWTTPVAVAVICFYFPALTPFSLSHLFPSCPA